MVLIPRLPWAEEGEVALEVTVEPSLARVGEPITMTVRASHPPGLEWEPRSVSDRHGSFDIQQVQGPETLPAGPVEATTRWTFRLAAFELGELEIPPLALRYRSPGSPDPLSAETPARKVTIEATVKGAEEEPADVRSGFLPPPESRLAWLLAGLGALAAGIGAVWLWRRRRRKPPKPAAAAPPRPRAPERPAYDRWLQELERLLAEDLIEAGRLREYHIRLAEIVKRYLGEVFAFDAIDRTSQEVLHDLEARARPTLRSETEVLLRQCDLVKFAEHVPAPEACREAAWRARVILALGRPAAPRDAARSAAAGSRVA